VSSKNLPPENTLNSSSVPMDENVPKALGQLNTISC
jgi:hypothetical protein